MDPLFRIDLAMLISSMYTFVFRFTTYEIPKFLNYVVSDTLTLIFVVAVPLVGLGIGLLNRLIKSN